MKSASRTQGRKRSAHAKPHVSHPSVHGKPHGHSPFFLLWELSTLTCVAIVGISFVILPFVHVSEFTHHQIELVVEAAEVILIAEVALLLIAARDKVHYVRKNWPTILAALPFGGAFRAVRGAKIALHAFDKTRMGTFLHHPLKSTRRWMHIKLGLRV